MAKTKCACPSEKTSSCKGCGGSASAPTTKGYGIQESKKTYAAPEIRTYQGFTGANDNYQSLASQRAESKQPSSGLELKIDRGLSYAISYQIAQATEELKRKLRRPEYGTNI